MKRLRSLLAPNPSRDELERQAAQELQAAGRAPGPDQVSPAPAVAPPQAADEEAAEEGDAEHPADPSTPPPRARVRKNPPTSAASRRSADGKVRAGSRQP